MSFSAHPAGPGFDFLLEAYRPLAGIPDEMVGPDGRPRPHWRRFLEMLATLGPEELGRRFASADRHVQEAGVYYRLYDEVGGSERPWPLAHMPLLMPPDEWDRLSAGLVERAELLEAVLRDLYGRQEGVLPAAVVAGSPAFLRPLVDAQEVTHLSFYAADVGRGPDGRWWVLDDRSEAPSGAAYALQNRMAIERSLPSIFRRMRVHRLADFFDAFRRTLAELGHGSGSRIGLLTPGMQNATYFEHAYLARYLGLLLVEGGDLTVREAMAYVRTVMGPQPIDVLWRRMDGAASDPLFLDSTSQLGVPGLVRAVRAGNLRIANSLGAGLAESRALLAFMPAIAERLLGRSPALPSIATWWCGDESSRRRVLGQLDELLVAPAHDGALLEEGLPRGPVAVATLDHEARARLVGAIERRGIDFVGQEMVKLSTMPVWDGKGLQPHPFLLRVFVARTRGGWKVMPGAFCQVSAGVNPLAISLRAGGRSADVWVIADGPVDSKSLLPGDDDAAVRRHTGALPSRAGDNFFWLGRYVERIDAALRLARAYIARMTEQPDDAAPVQAGLEAAMVELGVLEGVGKEGGPMDVARAACTGLSRIVGSAFNAAARIRDRFSPDGWRALRDLDALTAVACGPEASETDLAERIGQALRLVSAFSGLAQENMSRHTSWLFLETGRRLERAANTARFAQWFGTGAMGPLALDVLLELIDSSITYRQRYSIQASRATVIDLAVLDPGNPRSVAFQLERVAEHATALASRASEGMAGELEERARGLQERVGRARAAAIDDAFLEEIASGIEAVAALVGDSFFIDDTRGNESVRRADA
jgi:uncharacterized circularly permuted ATP-grasp superfamily protein/uncharacterized alpha-E superfamily protein